MKKAGCGMISYDGDKLAFFGGHGIPTSPTQPGSTFIRDTRYTDESGWTNEFHLFHLGEGKWTSPPTSGERSPPCSTFSLTMIDQRRAVLFGGFFKSVGRRTNDVYVIDLQSMHFTKLDKSGGSPWPVGRTAHAACCLNYGEEHPQLLVSGGRDKDVNTLSGMWLLDVNSGTWKEVALPEGVQPRYGHTATAFSLSPGLTEVSMFGGHPKRVPGGDDKQPKLTETTILQFESVETPAAGNRPSTREWVLTDIAGIKQLGSAERVREKMVKIQQRVGTTEGARLALTQAQLALQESQQRERALNESIAESERGREEAEWRAREAQSRKEEAERVAQRRVGDLQQRLTEAERGTQELERAAQRRVEEVERTAQWREEETQRRVQDLEQRLEQVEREVEEANRRAWDAERMLQVNDQPFWVVERREIHLTDEELGRGDWAAVKVAKFRGVKVAAKCLYRQIVSTYNRDLFIREMNVAAQVRHPNLFQFIGATLEGEMIILTELMPTSLRAILERGALPYQRTISISLDVAKALNYLHLMTPDPIIHRDISSSIPNNCWRAKVSDYGTANFLQHLKTENPGCPTYAAPEAHSPAQQSTKMDIFSFGVLLVETCSARFPDVAARERLIQSIGEPRLVTLIRQCTAEDKDTRPTAANLIQDLSEM